MGRVFLTTILTATICCWALAAQPEADDATAATREALGDALSEEFDDVPALHFRGAVVATVCGKGKQLRLRAPGLVAEEPDEDQVAALAKRIIKQCRVASVDAETAKALEREKQETAQLILKINNNKGLVAGGAGTDTLFLVLDAIGGLLLLVAVGWGLVLMRRRSGQDDPSSQVRQRFSKAAAKAATANGSAGKGGRPPTVVTDELLKSERIPPPQLADTEPPAVEGEPPAAEPPPGAEVEVPIDIDVDLGADDDGIPMAAGVELVDEVDDSQDHASAFDPEEAKTVLLDDGAMIAEVMATVAAMDEELPAEAPPGTAEAAPAAAPDPGSGFAQVSTTEPIPAANAPAATPLGEAPAVVQVGTEEPAAVQVGTEEPAPVAAAVTASRVYVFTSEDPRAHLGFAAAEAVDAVRKRLFDGSLLVEVESEGEDRGEIVVTSEWPERHPVSQEQTISYHVVNYPELYWRPIADGKFRTAYGDVALVSRAKHSWLLVLTLAAGQKFHNALLRPFCQAVGDLAQGMVSKPLPIEQVDRDWFEMAADSD